MRVRLNTIVKPGVLLGADKEQLPPIQYLQKLAFSTSRLKYWVSLYANWYLLKKVAAGQAFAIPDPATFYRNVICALSPTSKSATTFPDMHGDGDYSARTFRLQYPAAEAVDGALRAAKMRDDVCLEMATGLETLLWQHFAKTHRDFIRLQFNDYRAHPYDVQVGIFKGAEAHRPRIGEGDAARRDWSPSEASFIAAERHAMDLAPGSTYTDRHWTAGSRNRRVRVAAALGYRFRMLRALESRRDEILADRRAQYAAAAGGPADPATPPSPPLPPPSAPVPGPVPAPDSASAPGVEAEADGGGGGQRVRRRRKNRRGKNKNKRAKTSNDDDAAPTWIPRLFTLVPVYRVDLGSVKINTSSLRLSLTPRAVRLTYPKIEDADFDTKDELWASYFVIPKHSRWKFAHEIVTDGTSVSITYMEPAMRVAKSARRDMLIGAKVALTARKKKGARRDNEVIIANDLARGLYFEGELRLDPAGTTTEVIGIDPGRTDLMYAVNPDAPDGTPRTHTLSKKRYYHDCGFVDRAQKFRALARRTPVNIPGDPAEKTLEQLLSEVPALKTSHVDRLHERLTARSTIDSELWRHMATAARRNRRFTTHMRRTAVLDKFFRELVEPVRARGNNVIIAFGSAKFPTSARGELPGPLRRLSVRGRIHAGLMMTGEFRTSKKCATCARAGRDINVAHPKREKDVIERQYFTDANGRITVEKIRRRQTVSIHKSTMCKCFFLKIRINIGIATNFIDF
jgi:hypothetical protein